MQGGCFDLAFHNFKYDKSTISYYWLIFCDRTTLEVLLKLQSSSSAASPTQRPSAHDVLEHMTDFIIMHKSNPSELNPSRHSDTLLLLRLLMNHMSECHLHSPRRCLLFYRNYLRLAKQAVLVSLDADECIKIVPSEVLDCVHDRSMSLYNMLLQFSEDDSVDSKVFRYVASSLCYGY